MGGIQEEEPGESGTGADGVLRLECGGCDRPGDRGVVVRGGEAGQMDWGHVDFALKADLF